MRRYGYRSLAVDTEFEIGDRVVWTGDKLIDRLPMVVESQKASFGQCGVIVRMAHTTSGSGHPVWEVQWDDGTTSVINDEWLKRE